MSSSRRSRPQAAGRGGHRWIGIGGSCCEPAGGVGEAGEADEGIGPPRAGERGIGRDLIKRRRCVDGVARRQQPHRLTGQKLKRRIIQRRPTARRHSHNRREIHIRRGLRHHAERREAHGGRPVGILPDRLEALLRRLPIDVSLVEPVECRKQSWHQSRRGLPVGQEPLERGAQRHDPLVGDPANGEKPNAVIGVGQRLGKERLASPRHRGATGPVALSPPVPAHVVEPAPHEERRFPLSGIVAVGKLRQRRPPRRHHPRHRPLADERIGVVEAGAERGRCGHLLAPPLLVEAGKLAGSSLAGGKRREAIAAGAQTPLLHPQPPDLAAAVDRIAAVDPVGEQEGAVGGDRQVDRPELLIPLDRNPRGRPARSPIGPRLKHLQPVVPPTTHPQAPVEGDDVARGFAGAGGHREGAGQLAVPGLERMPPAAAIAKLIAVVTGGNDIDQPARRPAVGIVVNGEQSPLWIDAEPKGIPKAGGDPFEMVSFGGAAKHGSPLPFPRPARAVSSREFVGDAEVLAQADDEAAIGIEGHAAEAVVGIVAAGIEREEILTGVGDVVAIGVTDPEDR